MESMLHIVKSSAMWIALIPIAAFTLAKLMAVVLSEKTTSRSKARAKLFTLFDKACKEPELFTIEYIRTVISSVEREHEATLPAVTALQDYLVHTQLEKSADADPKVLDLSERIQELIETENQQQPFEGLPDDEKRLMRALNDAIQHSNADAVRFNMEELCSVLRVRNRTYQRQHALSRWSVPLAIFGLVITIIFGIMQITSNLSDRPVDEGLRIVLREELEALRTDVLQERVDKTSNKGLQATSGSAPSAVPQAPAKAAVEQRIDNAPAEFLEGTWPERGGGEW